MFKLSLFFSATVLFCLLVLGAGLPADSKTQAADATNQDLLKRGALVYKTRCVICHNAEGRSPNERLRLNDDEWKHGGKPEEIQKVVADGVKGTAMMGFKNRLNQNDIKAVTAYIMDLSEKAKSEATKR